ncbi:MAG: YdcF family protein [Bacteroidia bacterium]|nr:YdcF family protein [Bacteroidia bacterium]
MRKRLIKILKFSVYAGLFAGMLLLLTNMWVNARSNRFIYEDPAKVPANRVAMVLGTSAHTANGFQNLFFKYRMEAAAELYHQGKVKKIIVSGDNGDKSYDEPNAMRDALVKLGVPFRAVVLDYAGFRTLDSVVRTRDIFGQDEFVIISQKFHLQRAIFIARSKGMTVSGFRAKDPALRSTRMKVQVREFFARAKAVLDCYILGTQPRFLGEKEVI